MLHDWWHGVVNRINQAFRIGKACSIASLNRRYINGALFMSRSARADKVTVYDSLCCRASRSPRLPQAAGVYCASTSGATVAGPPAPYDVEIVVVTVALVESTVHK